MRLIAFLLFVWALSFVGCCLLVGTAISVGGWCLLVVCAVLTGYLAATLTAVRTDKKRYAKVPVGLMLGVIAGYGYYSSSPGSVAEMLPIVLRFALVTVVVVAATKFALSFETCAVSKANGM